MNAELAYSNDNRLPSRGRNDKLNALAHASGTTEISVHNAYRYTGRNITRPERLVQIARNLDKGMDSAEAIEKSYRQLKQC